MPGSLSQLIKKDHLKTTSYFVFKKKTTSKTTKIILIYDLHFGCHILGVYYEYELGYVFADTYLRGSEKSGPLFN